MFMYPFPFEDQTPMRVMVRCSAVWSDLSCATQTHTNARTLASSKILHTNSGIACIQSHFISAKSRLKCAAATHHALFSLSLHSSHRWFNRTLILTLGVIFFTVADVILFLLFVDDLIIFFCRQLLFLLLASICLLP